MKPNREQFIKISRLTPEQIVSVFKKIFPKYKHQIVYEAFFDHNSNDIKSAKPIAILITKNDIMMPLSFKQSRKVIKQCLIKDILKFKDIEDVRNGK